jgi:hypothetical protein
MYGLSGDLDGPNALGGRGHAQLGMMQQAQGMQNPYNQMGYFTTHSMVPIVSTICSSYAMAEMPYPLKRNKYRSKVIKPLSVSPYLCWLDKLFHSPP